MTKRINDKIKEIEEFLAQLNDLMPLSLKEYTENIEKKSTGERFAEKIIEALTDLAFLTIKYKKLEMPVDDIDAFNILLKNKIINNKLAAKLEDAKGMRNIIAHQYGKIDDKIVFHALTEELEKDAKEFIKVIKKS